MQNKFYLAGQIKAATDLGLKPSADVFVQFAKGFSPDNEDMQDWSDKSKTEKSIESKPRWSGRASLEAGDVGTRNVEMGLSSSGAV